MSKRMVDRYKSFTIHASWVDKNQVYVTASVSNTVEDPYMVFAELYARILDLLTAAEMHAVHERIFGSTCLYEKIAAKRAGMLRGKGMDSEVPFTYTEGRPCRGEGIAGVQIWAIKPCHPNDGVWTIYDNGTPCGRGWKSNGATHVILSGIHDLRPNAGPASHRGYQACGMFDRAEKILREHSWSYRNVVRTWINLADILDWYGDFNQVRNLKYQQFGLLPQRNTGENTEQIYLPASTGILGRNPFGKAVMMDLLAVIPQNGAQVKIDQITGIKQRSPFRYGSAFSRAMSIHEAGHTIMMISGTASIDERGKTLYPGDIRSQILKTVEVVENLIAKEGASLDDICDATMFLKRAEDFEIFQKTAAQFGLSDLPAICVVADVCRDDLLFEMDATVAVEHK